MDTVMSKEEALSKTISQYSSALVAFSGGIDSTVILKAALKDLGNQNVKAVVANSELFSDEEFDKAVKLGRSLGVEVIETEISYLTNDSIRNNTPESWYASKKMFYQRMNELKAKYGTDVVFDGIIYDDLSDYRPGLKARDEEEIISPLEINGFTKTDVRELARKFHLSNWNKVPSCSISSRFPYNTTITQEKIDMVMEAESFLRSLGFNTVRVRVQDTEARIEVPVDQMAELLNNNLAVNEELKKLGFAYVSMDLGGFISGHMNDELAESQKVAY